MPENRRQQEDVGSAAQLSDEMARSCAERLGSGVKTVMLLSVQHLVLNCFILNRITKLFRRMISVELENLRVNELA